MNVTQIILAINAMLIFAIAGINQVPGIGDDLQSIISFVLGILLAGIDVFIPKVSATWRRTMELTKRGS